MMAPETSRDPDGEFAPLHPDGPSYSFDRGYSQHSQGSSAAAPHGSTPQNPERPLLPSSDVHVGGSYEVQDQRGKWWGATVVERKTKDTVSVRLNDAFGTHWPSVSIAHLRHPQHGGDEEPGLPGNSCDGQQIALKAVSLCAVLDTLADAVAAPALPFLAMSIGASVADIVFLYSAWSLAQLVAGPVMDCFATRCGVRRVLLLSLLVQGCASLWQSMAPNYSVLLAARVLSGCFACAAGMSSAYLGHAGGSSFLRDGTQNRRTATHLAAILGPPLGGGLCQLSMGYGVPALLSGVLGVLNCVMVFVYAQEPVRGEVAYSTQTCKLGGGVNYSVQVSYAEYVDGKIHVHISASGDGSFGNIAAWERSSLTAVRLPSRGEGGHIDGTDRLLPLADLSSVTEMPGEEGPGSIRLEGELVFEAPADTSDVAEYVFTYGDRAAGYSSCVLPLGTFELCNCRSQNAAQVSALSFFCSHASKSTVTLCAASVLQGVCFSVVLAVFPVWSITVWEDVTPLIVGLYFSAAAVVATLPAVPVRSAAGYLALGDWLAARYGLARAAAIGATVCALALCMLPIVVSHPGLVAVLLCSAKAARSTCTAAMKALLQVHFGSLCRTELLFSARKACLAFGFSLGPLVYGPLMSLSWLPFLAAALAGWGAAYLVFTCDVPEVATQQWGGELEWAESQLSSSGDVDTEWADLGGRVVWLLRRRQYPVNTAGPYILQSINERFPHLDSTTRATYWQGLHMQGMSHSGLSSNVVQAADRACASEEQRM